MLGSAIAGAMIAVLIAGIMAAIVAVIGRRHRLAIAGMQAENLDLERRLAKALADAEASRLAIEESRRQFEVVRGQLADQFKALSSSALEENSTAFFKVAEETLKQYQALAKQELESKGTAIQAALVPLKESIALYNEKVSRIENERHMRDGQLSEQLASLFSLNQSLQKETANLVHALKKPDVRGAWGEMQLRRVVELSGMSEYCDFITQESTTTDEGRYRPDLVVKLPGNRPIVVDAKAVLSAYVEAAESVDEPTRQACLTRHARQLREQIHLLASKGYAALYENSADFVVCFLPGEAFLYAACMADRDLVEYGMRRNVIVATPTTLLALLKAVACGWRQEEIAKNAQVIGEHATELIERLSVALGHLHGHGQHLARTVESYNKFVGSIDHNVLPQAERMLDLGIAIKKPLPELLPVETLPRQYERGETLLALK